MLARLGKQELNTKVTHCYAPDLLDIIASNKVDHIASLEALKTINLMALMLLNPMCGCVIYMVQPENYTKTPNLITRVMENTTNPSLNRYRCNKPMLKES